jgi:DNA-binding NarL/FixJ family response regulator
LSQIRVAIVELPRMLRDIVVSMLATAVDIEVVTPSGSTSAFDAGADVVILNLDDVEPFDVLQELLAANPRLRVVAIAADGRRITLYELRPHRTPLGELSAAGLVAVVRDAGQALALERKWMGSANPNH